MSIDEPDGSFPSGSAFPPAPLSGVFLHSTVVGTGEPVTVFAHGLGESITAARPLGAGLPGARVFFDFRGHGGSTVSEPAEAGWGYPALADDLRTVADAHGATRAVGTSMGAAALLRLLSETPDRFDRLVFFLPAALDRVQPEGRARMEELARLVDAGDAEALAAVLLAYLPAAVRHSRVAAVHARGSAAELVGTEVSRVMRAIGDNAPLPSLDGLAAVQAPALVIGQEGDDVHRLVVARRLAAALPGARLEVFGPGGALWQERRRLRAVLADFLG
jgi:pimeloyl-ACP methyl ester carboxylesterase